MGTKKFGIIEPCKRYVRLVQKEVLFNVRLAVISNSVSQDVREVARHLYRA